MLTRVDSIFFRQEMQRPSLPGLYYVSLGAVQPVGEPLSSHFQKECVGVLQKFTLKEHRLLWNSLTRSW